jgi:hypothetical protein
LIGLTIIDLAANPKQNEARSPVINMVILFMLSVWLRKINLMNYGFSVVLEFIQ